MWWDDNDGPRPANLKLTTTISIGANYNSFDGTTLIDTSSPLAQQAQAVIDNYEELWLNNQITQEGIGVLDKGDVFDEVLTVYLSNEDEVTPEASFLEDLGADSLDIVELVMALEEEYELEISDEDAEGIKTVQDVVSYIEGHR